MQATDRQRSGGPASTSGNSSSGNALDGSNEDAAFHSRAVQAAVRHHQLWQGDLLSNADTFADFRRWVEDRLPQARGSQDYRRRTLCGGWCGQGGRELTQGPFPGVGKAAGRRAFGGVSRLACDGAWVSVGCALVRALAPTGVRGPPGAGPCDPAGLLHGGAGSGQHHHRGGARA